MHTAAESRLTDQRFTEWFLTQKAQQERNVLTPGPNVQSVITISRQFGAGGHTVAQQVAARLGPQWQIWDKEVIEKVAQSAQVRTEMVEVLDEHTHTWMDEMIRILFKDKVLESLGYRRHLAQVLLALAQQGNKIILGRGANFVLPDALNVRLRASVEFRTKVIIERDHISHHEALKKVQQADRDRAAFTRSVFNREIDDPSGYDMILQTDTLGFDVAAAVIIAAWQTKSGEGS